MPLLWLAALLFVFGAVVAYEGDPSPTIFGVGCGFAVAGIFVSTDLAALSIALGAAFLNSVFLVRARFLTAQKSADSAVETGRENQSASIGDELRSMVTEQPDSVTIWDVVADLDTDERRKLVEAIPASEDIDPAEADAIAACIATSDPEDVDALVESLESHHDRSPTVLRPALTGLRNTTHTSTGISRAVAVADRLPGYITISLETAPEAAIRLRSDAVRVVRAVVESNPDVLPVTETVRGLVTYLETMDEVTVRDYLGTDISDSPLTPARAEAAAALGHLAEAEPTAVRPHAGDITGLLDEPRTQSGALMALTAIETPDTAHLAGVRDRIDRLLETHDQPMARLEAARALAALGEQERALEAIADVRNGPLPPDCVDGPFDHGPRHRWMTIYATIRDELPHPAETQPMDYWDGGRSTNSDQADRIRAGLRAHVTLEASWALTQLATRPVDRTRGIKGIVEELVGGVFSKRAAEYLQTMATTDAAAIEEVADETAATLASSDCSLDASTFEIVCEAFETACTDVPGGLKTIANDRDRSQEIRQVAAKTIEQIESPTWKPR